MKNINSILESIKEKLGPEGAYDAFDPDIILSINTYLSVLWQVGIGPKNGFRVTGSGEEWSDFIEDDDPRYNMVKDYIYAKVKLVFDPPASAAAVTALNEIADELEWRLSVAPELIKNQNGGE